MVIGHSLTLLGSFRGWFVPLEPAHDTVHKNIHISDPNHHQCGNSHRRIQKGGEPTYLKQYVSAKTPSLVPRQDSQEASKARRRFSAYPSRTHLTGTQPVGHIIFLLVINSVEDKRVV